MDSNEYWSVVLFPEVAWLVVPATKSRSGSGKSISSRLYTILWYSIWYGMWYLEYSMAWLRTSNIKEPGRLVRP